MILATWLLARCLVVLVAIVHATKLLDAPEQEVVHANTAAQPTLVAGASLPRVDPPPAGARIVHAWCKLHASSFNVRCGPNYKRNKQKKPSQAALGEVVAMDAFRSSRKFYNLLQQPLHVDARVPIRESGPGTGSRRFHWLQLEPPAHSPMSIHAI